MVINFLEELVRFPDTRSWKGRKYNIGSMLALVLVGFLAGRDSLAGVIRYGKGLNKWQLRKLGMKNGKLPCHAALCNAFRDLDIDKLSEFFGRLVLGDSGDEQLVFNVDGKTLRGSKLVGESRAVHILHAFSKELGGVVGQVKVDKTTNEAKAILDLLEKIDIKGKIITGDAMFCQKEITKKIKDKGGDYMLTVKDNQKELHDKMDKSFEAEMLNLKKTL